MERASAVTRDRKSLSLQFLQNSNGFASCLLCFTSNSQRSGDQEVSVRAEKPLQQKTVEKSILGDDEDPPLSRDEQSLRHKGNSPL